MQAGPKINMRGPYGSSGGHFLTGPIYVCGAEPGDVLQVCYCNPSYDPDPCKRHSNESAVETPSDHPCERLSALGGELHNLCKLVTEERSIEQVILNTCTNLERF